MPPSVGQAGELCAALYAAATTDACLELLDTAGLRAPVLESLLDAIQLHLDRRRVKPSGWVQCCFPTSTAAWRNTNCKGAA